jgi:hypothetical protein
MFERAAKKHMGKRGMSRFGRVVALMIGMAFGVMSGGMGTAFAAAGSDPLGPINPVKTGADLKHACGQGVQGYHKVVGQKTWRDMMMVQCRAVVGAVVELVAAGQVAGKDGPVWRCVQSPDDHDALTATFVQWVGRRAPLLREPAAVAFVEAIEMSEKCSS